MIAPLIMRRGTRIINTTLISIREMRGMTTVLSIRITMLRRLRKAVFTMDTLNRCSVPNGIRKQTLDAVKRAVFMNRSVTIKWKYGSKAGEIMSCRMKNYDSQIFLF